MATLVVQQQQPLRKSRTPPPPVSPVNVNAQRVKANALPNKHIPYCSPGPAPATQPPVPVTPPTSPERENAADKESPLYPIDDFQTTLFSDPPVYAVETKTVARALELVSSKSLPDPKLVFPWLHGLHPANQVQQAFFIARRKSLRKMPNCIRGVTIVKAGGDLTRARLKGAIAPAEVLAPTLVKDSMFFDADPKEGFSVRNFHIQTAKLATLSDIVVYKDDNTKYEELKSVAKRFSKAQRRYRDKCNAAGTEIPEYNTFVITDSFESLEQEYPELVAVNAKGESTGKVVDFFQLERQEMCKMSKASLIAPNVWLGPTPDPTIMGVTGNEQDAPEFDIMIEASDLARMPETKVLKEVAEASLSNPQAIEFPSSGSILPPTWSHAEVDGLLEVCRWIFDLSSGQHTPEPSDDGKEPQKDQDGDIQMQTFGSKSRRILIHCADGYTESSLLAMAYYMYSECLPLHEAWIRLHTEKQRNFFAYGSDVALLSSIQPRIMQESPKGVGDIPSCLPDDPQWLKMLDGSLPSRILPYMYLGNLNHANNPGLLRELGIKRVLSVGEPVNWSKAELRGWGDENLMFIDQVQDNGVDSLNEQFDKCLEFVGSGKEQNTATLVHCRVGVSRSATICIAEVMASMGLSFPRAYCFVRARRLNVIIQPHLRFVYELLKWEELQLSKKSPSPQRELEWQCIAREIAAMNKPYTR